MILTNCKAQPIEVELYFHNSCKSTIDTMEFELVDLFSSKTYSSQHGIVKVDTMGYYMLSIYLLNENYVESYYKYIDILQEGKITDTIFIPKIRFQTETALHSQYWNYVNCGQICNGEEIDFYPNGNKRISGFFTNGKPSEITEYRNNGTKETISFFTLNDSRPHKIEYYDNNEKLESYEVHLHRRNKTIVKIFNSSGKLIEKEKH